MCRSQTRLVRATSRRPSQTLFAEGIRSRRRRSTVRLGGRVAAPAVCGVIERHGGIELGNVVPMHSREPERCREQAGAFGSEVKPASVSTTYDRGETEQRLGREPK